jgi:hypothetical protein
MKANSIELDEASWEGFKNVAKNFTDAARRSVGASVGLNRNALYQFTGELVQNAINDISAAIDSGMVDPSLVDAPTPPKPTAPPTEPGPIPEPGSAPSPSPAPTGGKSTKVAPGNAAVPSDAQKQTTQNINNYVRSVAASLNAETDRAKKIALTKELINFMADRKGYPEWQNAFGTVKAILQRNRAGGNMLRALQNGTRLAEAWQVYFINKLIESVSLTWEDLGLVLLKENKSNKYVIAESKFYKLNVIFESIINEEGEGGKESIASYLLRWLTQYTNSMGNFSNDAQIKALASQVQATWAKDKGKAALQKMAQNIWSKSRAGGAAPSAPAAGGRDAGTGGAETTAPTAPTGGAGGGAAPTAPTGDGTEPTAPTGGAGGGAASEPENVTKGTQALKIINTMVDRSDLPDLEKIVNASLAKVKKMDPDQFRNLIRLFSSGSYDPLKATAPAAPKKNFPLPGGSQPFNSAATVARPSRPTPLPPGSSPTAENRRIVRKAIK